MITDFKTPCVMKSTYISFIQTYVYVYSKRQKKLYIEKCTLVIYLHLKIFLLLVFETKTKKKKFELQKNFFAVLKGGGL